MIQPTIFAILAFTMPAATTFEDYDKQLKTLKRNREWIDVANQYAWELSRLNTQKALGIAEEAYERSKKARYKQGLAESLRTIGQCYWLVGDYSNTIEHIQRSLNYFEKIKDLKGQAEIYNLFGGLYSSMEDAQKAEENFRKAYEMRKKIGDLEGQAKSLNSLGDLTLKQKQYDKALKLFQESLSIPHDNYMYKGIISYNLAESYYHLDQLDKAWEAILHCRQIGEELDFGLMDLYSSWLMGKIEGKRGQQKAALEHLQAAIEVGEKINAKDRLFHIYKDISDVHHAIGQVEEAFAAYKKFHEIKEKVFNEDSSQKLKNMEYQGKMKYLKDKTKLEQKKNRELQKAYDQITRQQKEIKDSIYYAQRIQQAILPGEEMIKAVFPDFFVIYLPKDILSGDFYRFSTVENNDGLHLSLVTLADCTGHGVPGALMSMLGNNYLMLAESEPRVNSPAEALDFLNEGVHKSLQVKTDHGNIRDGMDVSLAAIDLQAMKLYYAGAKNPAYVFQSGEMVEIKGDRHPIGHYVGNSILRFTNKELKVNKGDVIYLFTDGYVDQFGGPKGRKFMYKQFRDVLADIHHLPMPDQKTKLLQYLEEWRGDFKQTDDICVIGIRI